jgi:aspartyl-tRNA(Asn)/glutamyl-tRNA(Gln) amidotransferase subunit C
MASKLTREEVLRVARLAHLELSDAEVELFTHQLADILAYASDVQQVDTADVPPTSHALTSGPMWREDVPAPSLDRDEVLANAPDARREAGLFRVPKVL